MFYVLNNRILERIREQEPVGLSAEGDWTYAVEKEGRILIGTEFFKVSAPLLSGLKLVGLLLDAALVLFPVCEHSSISIWDLGQLKILRNFGAIDF